MGLELAFRTSVLVDIGRCWLSFDGPATAQTAQAEAEAKAQEEAAAQANAEQKPE
jgi:hypothetical protein